LSGINTFNPSKIINKLSVSATNKMNSIKRISSGLRISGAKDDPSGLSISERLRARINGFDMAISNSQNAISLTQTAEGALDETSSVLQRMRTLAIEANSDTLTSNDKVEIQKEIDQLKSEIDRIAISTEFNTKKLLNGDSASLWSSTSQKIGIEVLDKVQEGNYSLEITQIPGAAQVIKSDIFNIKKGVASIENIDLNGSSDQLITAPSGGVSADFIWDFDGDIYRWTNANVGLDRYDTAVIINDHEVLSKYIIAEATPANGLIFRSKNEGLSGNSYRVKSFDNSPESVEFGIGDFWQSFSGGIESETGIENLNSNSGLISSKLDGDYTLSATSNLPAAANSSQTMGAYGYSNSSTISNITTTLNNVEEGGRYAMIEMLNSSNFTDSSSGAIDIRFSFDEGETWNSQRYDNVVFSSTGFNLSDGINSLTINASGTRFLNEGDKLLVALNDYSINGAGNYENISIKTPIIDGLGNVTQTSRDFTFETGSLDRRSATLNIVQLDVKNGDWYAGEINLELGNSNLATGSISFDVKSAGIANRGSKLKDIQKFYDDNGNFILGENGKSITIYNSFGDSTDIYIDGEDTIGEIADKINSSMVDDLKMGTGNNTADSHLAEYITQGYESTEASVKGTIVIRSTLPGQDGQIFFSSDEDLLNALSLTTVKEPSDSEMKVKVTDAHTNEYLGQDTVTNSTLHNIIEGVDIKINPSIAFDVKFSHSKMGFNFISKESISEQIHIVDNSESFQIGASQNQTLVLAIGQMNSKSLGIDNLIVIEGKSASKAITKVDSAIEKVSRERAKLGATINRLEHTINNLMVQGENATSSESGIRDLDIARETAAFAKHKLVSELQVSMLSKVKESSKDILMLIK